MYRGEILTRREIEQVLDKLREELDQVFKNNQQYGNMFRRRLVRQRLLRKGVKLNGQKFSREKQKAGKNW
jgi:hypothetical protein